MFYIYKCLTVYIQVKHKYLTFSSAKHLQVLNIQYLNILKCSSVYHSHVLNRFNIKNDTFPTLNFKNPLSNPFFARIHLFRYL